MTTTIEIKQRNLRAVIDKFHDGTTRKLELAMGKQEGSLSRYFSDSDSAREIGAVLCRQVEDFHNLGFNWMITDHDATQQLSSEQVMLLEIYDGLDEKQQKKFIKLLMKEVHSS